MMRPLVTGVAAALGLSACTSGTSTTEVENAAKERARQELQLPADAPLESTAWVGAEQEAGIVVCGTVSGSAAAAPIPPMRFAAHPDPIRWIHFENAHAASIPANPDKFVTWIEMCGNRDGTGAPVEAI